MLDHLCKAARAKMIIRAKYTDHLSLWAANFVHEVKKIHRMHSREVIQHGADGLRPPPCWEGAVGPIHAEAVITT